MKLSQDGLTAIKKRECLPPDYEPVLTSYQDGSGIWTIGCGHTGDEVRVGQTISY
jgi:GH24 family phage-related lysozyme (muramidase)